MTMQAERIKVLYVDDEEGNLTAFRASFRREFEVHTMASGRTSRTCSVKAGYMMRDQAVPPAHKRRPVSVKRQVRS